MLLILNAAEAILHDTFENLPNPHSEVNIIFADYHYACIRSDRHFLFFIITLLIEILGISKFFLRHSLLDTRVRLGFSLFVLIYIV